MAAVCCTHQVLHRKRPSIVERTQDGLAADRARGRMGGGRVTPTKAPQARAMYDQKDYTVRQIAETFGVSRGTIYRHLIEDTGRT